MRWALVLVVFASLVAAAGASSLTGPEERAIAKLTEAMRLERRAVELFRENQADPEVDELVKRSQELLREAYGLPGLSERAKSEVGYAFKRDSKFLQGKPGDPQGSVTNLEIALLEKAAAIRIIEDDSWAAASSKATPATNVSTPNCRSTSAVGIPGCAGIDFWEINVSAGAKRAKCSFRGPRGELTPGRPLFPGTAQETTCKLTNRFLVVGGERKRIVRAELHITVLTGTNVKGTKPVTVTASWR